ncbi:MAG TPA: branched-chain amino acid ABC transporter permease [Roseiarcus sp.]|nr:branched-chain amino acid ABC transporter permease [Roseiarcus sp.]
MALVNILIDGVMVGALYALFAAGLSLIFGVMRLVNLAHGDLIVVAAYLILVVAERSGLSIFFALAIVAPLMFALGYGLQIGLLNRVLGADILPPLLVTFGLSIILQNGALALFSADSRRLPAFGLDSASLPIGPFAVGVMPMLTLLAAVVVIFALNRLFYASAIGRAFRAVSDDATTAQLMGVSNSKIFAIAMGLALAVSAIAALFLGARANFDPSIGPGRLIFAFEAVIIGGLGSLWGTLAGGVILGVAQTIGAALNPEWQLLAGHVAFLAMLVARPRGLFPRAND